MRTLDTVRPASLDNKLEEIVQWMCANYSLGRDRSKVEERVVCSVETLVSRQQRWRVSAQRWTCSYQDCRNRNFGWRKYCNRCRQPKSPIRLSGREEVEKSNSVKLFPEDLRNDIERKRNISGASKTAAKSNDSFVKTTRKRKEQLSLYSKSYRGGSRGRSRERREQPREKERRHESRQRSRSLVRCDGSAISHSRNNSKSGSRRRSPRKYKKCPHTHYSSSHLSKTSRGTTYSYSYKYKSRERSRERTGCRERFRERSRERSRERCRLSESVERRRRFPILEEEERYGGRDRNPIPGRGSDLRGAPPPTSYLTQHTQFPNVFILNTLPPGRGFL